MPTPNSQRQPTLSQNPPVHLISPLPLQKPPERSQQWKLLSPNPQPSNLHPYLLHNFIMSDKNHVFCAFMDVITNSSTLRACSFRYKVHPRIIQNLLDEYHYHQLSRTRQEKEPLAETNNPNQITRWAQERLGLSRGNQTYTDWELLTACKIRVLSNTSYAHLKSEYGIPHSTLKRYLAKICPSLQCRNAQHLHQMLKKGEVLRSKVLETIKMNVHRIKV